MKISIAPLIKNYDNYTQSICWMILSAVWFAIMTSLIRELSTEMHPLQMVFLRNLFAFLLVLPWVKRSGFGVLKTKNLKFHLIRGISGVIGVCTWFYSLSKIPLTEAVALSYTVPIFTVILAVIFFKEKVSLHRWLAILIGLSGVFIILRPGLNVLNLASILVVFTTFTWAISNIMVKHMTREDSPDVIIFYMMLIMLITSSVFPFFVWETPTIKQLILLFILGFVSINAHYSLANSFAREQMSRILPFDFTRLIFVTIFALIFFNEHPDAWSYIGATIILLSSIYVVRQERRGVADGI